MRPIFLLPTVDRDIKRKLQMNIPHKHRYKKSPQNLYKPISTAYTKKNQTLWSSGTDARNARLI